jgi:hypothetical protein
MRRVLRLGDMVDRNAILGARRNTTTAIVLSGIRCIITYLLIPILAPVIGFLQVLGPPLTITLSVVAIGMGISGVRRFWMADHKHRWSYTGFIGLVNVLLLIGIGFEVRSLI